MRAIAEGIISDLAELGVTPVGVEGFDASRWALIDFGDVLVHVFDGPMRGFYDLESMWADARPIRLEDGPAPVRSALGQSSG